MERKERSAEHYFMERPTSKAKYGLVRACLRGRMFDFVTASGVFSKERVDLGTRLLVESMVLPEQGCVLDVGCGYGVAGIAAAALNPCLRVVMVDVNVRAVRLARQNVELNNLWNVEVRRGHLYEPVEGLMFDCVVSNPPVSAGMKIVEGIIVEAPWHMSSGATLQVVVRSKIGGKRLQSIFEKAFGHVEVLARGSGYRVLMSGKE
jgi:16S rRNA (guanine1207-N2)-methyltransferase